jgi:hypothetical protein
VRFGDDGESLFYEPCPYKLGLAHARVGVEMASAATDD